MILILLYRFILMSYSILFANLSNNFVNHFGTEAIEPLVDKLNTFHDALLLNLEKFREITTTCLPSSSET
jgi:hypothetical protein